MRRARFFVRGAGGVETFLDFGGLLARAGAGLKARLKAPLCHTRSAAAKAVRIGASARWRTPAWIARRSCRFRPPPLAPPSRPRLPARRRCWRSPSPLAYLSKGSRSRAQCSRSSRSMATRPNPPTRAPRAPPRAPRRASFRAPARPSPRALLPDQARLRSSRLRARKSSSTRSSSRSSMPC